MTRRHDIVLAELWEQCRKLGIALPQPRPVARSSIAKARRRVDPGFFHEVHGIILEHAGEGPGWKGHRILAIDGTRMNLPRPLAGEGYATPNGGAHHPQGLVSCLYRTGDGVPKPSRCLPMAVNGPRPGAISITSGRAMS